MSLTVTASMLVYLASLGCALGARRQSSLAWAACVLAVIAAGLALYGGVGLDVLTAGATLAALPLACRRSGKQEGP